MFDWLRDIPAVVWTAIITGAFLTGQQAFNNRREDRRRQDDADERRQEREHATRQAQLDRDHQRALALEAAHRELEERWRDDRREVHARMLRLFNAAIREITAAKNEKVREIRSEQGDPFHVDALTNQTFKGLDEAMADVRILASDQSAADAWTAMSAIVSLDQHVEGLLSEDQLGASAWRETFDKCTQKYYAGFNDYRRSLRRDLGVSETRREAIGDES